MRRYVTGKIYRSVCMTSILIANTAYSLAQVSAKSEENSDSVDFLMGYFSDKELEEQNKRVLSSFFNSLITHEEIYLTLPTLQLVLDNIGFTDLLKLLQNKAIKTCFGLGDNVVMLDGGQGRLSTIYRASSDINRFENTLATKGMAKDRDFNTLIQYTENSSVNLDKEVNELGVKEVVSDLSSSKIRTDLMLCSESINEIRQVDFLRTLRLADVAQSLVVQSKLNISSMAQDGYSSTYIRSKLGTLSSLVGDDPTKVFASILEQKGIPDIYPLYRKGIISIDDILRLRNNFNGGLFRKWFASEDYDEKEVIKTLLNKSSDSQLSKFIRFLYPNVFGLISPIAGAASAAFDSYIVNRILEGWNPSLFLDDVLKSNIDNKIRLFDERKKREEFIARFGSVGRNDMCPCQSGKKYKKCHGR
ncbi:SEC-C domain-containing protein [Vibrio parahaemolyticus]|nr:SEC-C domain-containing protein [Vibrio parahaemolyticus]